MKSNSWTAFWMFVLSMLVAAVQFVATVFRFGEVAWIGIVGVVMCALVTAYMMNGRSSLSAQPAWFTLGGVVVGLIVRFGDGVTTTAHAARILLPIVLVGVISYMRWLLSRGQFNWPLALLAHGVMVMCVTIMQSWVGITIWGILLFILWSVTRFREAREETAHLPT
jgi:hypothetical protein